MIRQSLLSILARGMGSLAAFALSVLVGREFGPAGSGAFFSGLAVLALAAVVARAGMDVMVLREVAANTQAGDRKAAGAIVWRGLRTVVVIAVLVSLLMFVGASLLGQQLNNPVLVLVLQWLALGLLPVALSFVGAEALKAQGVVVAAQAQQVLWVPLIAMALLLLNGAAAGVQAAAACYAAACWLTGALSLVALWRRFGRPPALLPHASWFGNREGWLLCLSALSVVANGYADLLMLNLVADPVEVGWYGAATRWALLVQIIPLAMAGVVGPRVAALWSAGRADEAYAFARRMARLGVLVAATPCAIFLAASADLLGVFGRGFEGGSGALRLLAVAFLLSQALGFGGVVLTMTGRSRVLLGSSLVALAVNTLGALALSARFGAMGAAMAASLAMIVARLLPAIYVWRQDRTLITV